VCAAVACKRSYLHTHIFRKCIFAISVRKCYSIWKLVLCVRENTQFHVDYYLLCTYKHLRLHYSSAVCVCVNYLTFFCIYIIISNFANYTNTHYTFITAALFYLNTFNFYFQCWHHISLSVPFSNIMICVNLIFFVINVIMSRLLLTTASTFFGEKFPSTNIGNLPCGVAVFTQIQFVNYACRAVETSFRRLFTC
jgi:hypothetical protein